MYGFSEGYTFLMATCSNWKKCWLATIIDFNICNIHSNLDRWIIIVEHNVSLQGSMHPVKFLSRGRDGDYGGRLASCLRLLRDI